MKYLKNIFEEIILFLIGALMYYSIEILWRGFSHWTMAILGGICFVIIGCLNNFIPWEIKFWKQMLLGSITITSLEFIFGYILNIVLKMGIWDYSNMPFNIMGQVCILYSFLWFLLSAFAIILDDFIRWKLFKENKPVYYF